MVNGGVVAPGLTGVLQMLLETTPFVPFQSTVCQHQQDDDCNNDDSPNLGDLDKVDTKIVDDRHINIVAKR